MALHTKVEATKTIARQAISTTLENYSFRLIIGHNGLNDRFKDGLVCRIINTISQREVDGIVLTSANTDVAKLACTWKVFAILVERDSHNSVRGIKSFFNAIAVVNVDVDVENPLLEAEKLNDT
jgi:hypothetical protein